MTDEAEGNAGLLARINKLGADKASRADQLAAARGQLEALTSRAGLVDAMELAVRDLQGKLTVANDHATRTDALLGAGVTDASAREFLAYQYGKTSPDDRPEFGAWLSDQREGAEGFTAHIFGAHQTTTTAPDPARPAGTAAPEPAPQIRTDGGSVQPVPNGGRMSWQQMLDPSTPYAAVMAEWTAGKGTG